MPIWTPEMYRQKMRELRLRQRTGTSRSQSIACLRGIEQSELQAIRKLAHSTFGDRANLFATATRPGILQLGVFTADDAHLPPYKRATTIVAVGRTHREIVDQLALWRSSQQ